MAKEAFKMDADDIRNLQRDLREIEPGLLREFRRELKAIAKPVNQQIKANIPKVEPLSGMGAIVQSKSGAISFNQGRLRWASPGARGSSGGRVKAASTNSTTVSSSLKRGSRSLTASLLSIRINNPSVAMADMAGRSGGGGQRGKSREYTYRKRNGQIVQRRHSVTTQGQHMIRNLGSRASRYGWAALEHKFDQVQREVNKVIDKYYKIANRGN
jgi:hypothetical protein